MLMKLPFRIERSSTRSAFKLIGSRCAVGWHPIDPRPHPRNSLSTGTAAARYVDCTACCMTMTEQDLLTPDGLKELAAAKGPCITIAVPSTDGRDVRIRMKEALQRVKENLGKYNGSVDTDALLAPLAPIAGTPA